MTQTELEMAATKYVQKALKTSDGKDPTPAKVKRTVNAIVRKFAPIVKNKD